MFERARIWQSVVMHPALAFLWFLPSIVFGVGTVITIVALRRAPDGFEDTDGFHCLHLSDAARRADSSASADVVHRGVELA